MLRINRFTLGVLDPRIGLAELFKDKEEFKVQGRRVTDRSLAKQQQYIRKTRFVLQLSDQLGQYYTLIRRTVKWWKKLFFHLLNLLVVNESMLFATSMGPR